MIPRNLFRSGPVAILLGTLLVPLAYPAGIEKKLQNEYVERYLNKTIFLKVPVNGLRQVVEVDSGGRLGVSGQQEALVFKVGEQVRVTGLEFKDRSIRFKLSGLEGSREAMLLFQFAEPLQAEFEQRSGFEEALLFAFTEGVSYRDIESAKSEFIEGQYDELIRTFAASTGTSREFVVQQIAEQNPEYKKALTEASRLAARVSSLESSLVGTAEKLKAEEARSAGLRQQLESASLSADEEKEERLRFLDERDEARAENRRLRAEMDEMKSSQVAYEKQLNELLISLNPEAEDSGDEGSRVESLGTLVNDLQSARSTLSSQLEQVRGQVSELQSEGQQLREKLSRTERENRRLSSRLKALTSDKKSINSQYLKMREEKEILETADALSRTLRVEPGDEAEGEEGWKESRFFLDSQLLGHLRILPPHQPGDTARLEMSLVSPDTVKFSEQERELYAALGEEVRVEAGWIAPEELALELNGEGSRRTLKVRETTAWEWNVSGQLTGSQPATLQISLVDQNDQKIPLHSRQFVVHASGLGNWLSGLLSFPSLLAGLILGAVVALILGRRFPGSTATPPARHPVEYLEEKEF